MRQSTEKRGRRGGRTRAGEFYHAAECGVQYTARSVHAFFLSKGEQLDYSEARSIFDSLRRSKCYLSVECKSEKGSKGRPIPTIKFTHKVMNSISLPPTVKSALNGLECDSLADNLMSKLVRIDLGKALSFKSLSLSASDPKLLKHAQAHASGEPICVSGGFYRIEAYELKGDKVKLVLVSFPMLHAVMAGVRKAAAGALKKAVQLSKKSNIGTLKDSHICAIFYSIAGGNPPVDLIDDARRNGREIKHNDALAS